MGHFASVVALVAAGLLCGKPAHAADALPTPELAEWETIKVGETPFLVSVLGPITSGAEISLGPPTIEEIVAAIPSERDRKDVARVLTEKKEIRATLSPAGEVVDAMKRYPLLGWARQHHQFYDAVFYFEDGPEVVIRIDYNHLHVRDKLE